MQVGMLWLDDDKKRPFTEKIERAAAYYEDKYGRQPTRCFVHPQMLTETTTVGKIIIDALASVRPNHFWLGIESSDRLA